MDLANIYAKLWDVGSGLQTSLFKNMKKFCLTVICWTDTTIGWFVCSTFSTFVRTIHNMHNNKMTTNQLLLIHHLYKKNLTYIWQVVTCDTSVSDTFESDDLCRFVCLQRTITIEGVDRLYHVVLFPATIVEGWRWVCKLTDLYSTSLKNWL